jgi:pectinesterase inhibitor-like protein
MQPLAAVLAFVLLAAAATADPWPSPATINATCSVFATTYAYPSYDYCVNVLSSSDPAAASAMDLAIIPANATAQNVTHTVDLINDLRDGLTRCSEFYGRDMGDKVASALGDLVAGRNPWDKFADAYNLGPVNCDIALTQKWGYSKDLLANENWDSMALALLARNIARMIRGSSNSTAGGAPSPAAIINATCSSLLYNKYPGYDYCHGVLSSDASAAASARSTRDLAIIAANATAHNITSTVKLIQALLSDLAECKVSYSRMGSTLDSALGDLIAGHASAGVANKLRDASNDAISCDVVMTKRRGAADNVLRQENGQNFLSAQFASDIALLRYLGGL